jgi:sugar/nucleoside kinase (ribokinase family)
MKKPKTYDVYSYGVIASSVLYLLRGDFPTRSGYAEFTKKYKNVGGEAANSSLVLSRLGLTVKLDGNWIKPDEDAAYLKAVFNCNKVDITSVSFQECSGLKEMLVVDSSSRTIFGNYEQLLQEKTWNLPNEGDIQNAGLVSLDPFFGDASLKVVEFALQHEKPIVTIDCRFDDAIFLAADIAIISEEFLRHAYLEDNVHKVTSQYLDGAKGTVIFTFGHKEILYGSKDEALKLFTPFRVNPVDTTGAGDSFRAGIIYGLLNEWSVERTIKFASALAALVCQSFPGVLNSPSVEQVKAFIEKRKKPDL